jgi:hypothetical protein
MRQTEMARSSLQSIGAFTSNVRMMMMMMLLLRRHA